MNEPEMILDIIRQRLHDAEDSLYSFKKQFRKHEDDEIEMNKLYNHTESRKEVLDNAKTKVHNLELCVIWLKPHIDKS